MRREEKAARSFNRWWQNRTSTTQQVAMPAGVEVLVNAEALRVLTMYARAMSIVAERRRCRILELQGRLS